MDQTFPEISSTNPDSLYETMICESAVGIGLLGLDRRIIDANPAVCRMLGYEIEELKGLPFSDAVYPDDLDSDRDLIDDLLQGKRSNYKAERRYIRKDGRTFWGRATITLVRGPDGEPLYMVGTLEDIDEQRHIQESLRESEARFRAMFDNVAVGMSLMTLDRRVISLNQAATRIIGYTIDELSDLDPADLAHPEDRHIGAVEFEELVAGKRTGFSMEKRYLHKDGSLIWARVTYSIVPDQDGIPEYLIGMIEDITEQKFASEKLSAQEAEYRRTLEKRVEERTRELEEANQRLREEIDQRQRVEKTLASKAAEDAVLAERSRLARDLHDAVTQTLFSASLIAEVLPQLWQIDAQAAAQSTEELRQLTRGALAEMRTLLLELRPATLTQARFDDLLRQLADALIGRTRLPINVTIEGERALPAEVQVAFYRIAQECLNNIIKHSHAEQVDIHVMLSVVGAVMDIRDDGVGFDTSTLKPTSLGMRIMRERADTIGAEYIISSHPGEGTRVVVTWISPELVEVNHG